ncbi:hypothetical protein G6689_01620 [Polynucleobacter paneuropaeus]|nr:hypothetical protein G6689_01620 [Polynucleobacter paneuropaeus]
MPDPGHPLVLVLALALCPTSQDLASFIILAFELSPYLPTQSDEQTHEEATR